MTRRQAWTLLVTRAACCVTVVAGMLADRLWIYLAATAILLLTTPLERAMRSAQRDLLDARLQQRALTEDDTESWLRALKVEYVAGDLTLEQYEEEVQRYLALGENSRSYKTNYGRTIERRPWSCEKEGHVFELGSMTCIQCDALWEDV